MITKKNLWFLTLFSIILVMAVYYVSLPNTNLVNKTVDSGKEVNVEIKESDSINALKVSRDETLEHEVAAIKEILIDEAKTTEEKSDAYEALKELNSTKGKEELLENIIKNDFNYDGYVKIDGSNVKVVIDSSSHSYELANKIMTTIQKQFDKKMYVTVSFGTL